MTPARIPSSIPLRILLRSPPMIRMFIWRFFFFKYLQTFLKEYPQIFSRNPSLVPLVIFSGKKSFWIFLRTSPGSPARIRKLIQGFPNEYLYFAFLWNILQIFLKKFIQHFSPRIPKIVSKKVISVMEAILFFFILYPIVWVLKNALERFLRDPSSRSRGL